MELLPIRPFDRAFWHDLTDEQFAEMNENNVWILQNATDIHGERLTVEERNALIRQHNDSVAIQEGYAHMPRETLEEEGMDGAGARTR